MRGVDWRFNAWGGLHGGLYFPWDQDELVARKVLEIEGCDRYAAAMVNEGGAIHVDGAGHRARHRRMPAQPEPQSRDEPRADRAALRAYLGVRTIIWLGKGVFNDETDGHIDNLACFVRPGEVCLTWTDDTRDPQHAISHDAWERLNDARDARGRRLKVHKLPMPGPLYMTAQEARGIARRAGHQAAPRRRAAGRQLRQLLHRQRRHRDAAARPTHGSRGCRASAQALPGRSVVGVPAREILLGGGNIHCITQQVPAARESEVCASAAIRLSRCRRGYNTPRTAGAFVMAHEREVVLHSWCVQADWNAPTVVGGRGARLLLEDGREMLDMSSLAECSNLGHQHPRMVAAIREQAEQLCFVTSSLGREAARRARGAAAGARRLRGRAGLLHAGRRRCQRERREDRAGRRRRSRTALIITRDRSYHGASHMAMALSGDSRTSQQVDAAGWGVRHVPPPYAYRCPFRSTDADECGRLAANAVARVHRRGGRRQGRRGADGSPTPAPMGSSHRTITGRRCASSPQSAAYG